ncbi:MAG: family 4 glycosyl hydrolase [Planctomycetota bacterium]
MDARIERNEARIRRCEQWISGEDEFEAGRSRETVASIVEAIHTGGELVDDLNLVNTGQITNLPRGVVVETLGVASPLGFMPCGYGELPKGIAAMTVPHCVNQQLVMKAATTGDGKAAYRALAGDPLLSHLTPKDRRRLFDELMKANRPWLPEGLK